MPSRHVEVSVLPSVVLLAVLASVVLLERLRRRAALTVPRAVVGVVAAVFVAGMLGNTVLPVHLGRSSDRAWWQYLHLTPLVGTDPRDMVMNVVVFLPLGVLLPLIARVRSARRVLLIGFLTSLTMELLQWVNAVTVHGGHLPDVNDLLANTVGTPLGYGAFRAALALPGFARLARAATWPVAPREGAAVHPAAVGS